MAFYLLSKSRIKTFAIEVVLNFFANTKGSGTSFQIAVFVEFFGKVFFAMWHKLAEFN